MPKGEWQVPQRTDNLLSPARPQQKKVPQHIPTGLGCAHEACNGRWQRAFVACAGRWGGSSLPQRIRDSCKGKRLLRPPARVGPEQSA